MTPNLTHTKGKFFVDEKPVNTSQVMRLVEQLIEANAKLHKRATKAENDLAKERHKVRLLLEESDNGIDSPE